MNRRWASTALHRSALRAAAAAGKDDVQITEHIVSLFIVLFMYKKFITAIAEKADSCDQK